MSATYTKLKTGGWGIRVQGENAVRAGQNVTVTTKAGKIKEETVRKVLWTGNGITLCAVEPRDRHGDIIRTDDHGRPTCEDCGKWTSGKYRLCYSCAEEEREAM